MSQNSIAFSFDDNVELPLDRLPSNMETVADEVEGGRRDLVNAQKEHDNYIKCGGKTGITSQFGRIIIDCAPTDAGAVVRLDVEPFKKNQIPHRHAGEFDTRIFSKHGLEFSEILAKTLNSPELKHLLENPLPTMLWSPATEGMLSTYLPLADMSATSATTQFDRIQSDVSADTRQGSSQARDFVGQGKHYYPTPLLETKRVGKVNELPAAPDAGNGRGETSDYLATAEKNSPAGASNEGEMLERGLEASRPQRRPLGLRKTLERPAAGRRTAQQQLFLAMRPKLRPTLERPGKLEEIGDAKGRISEAGARSRQTDDRPDNHAAGASGAAVLEQDRPPQVREAYADHVHADETKRSSDAQHCEPQNSPLAHTEARTRETTKTGKEIGAETVIRRVGTLEAGGRVRKGASSMPIAMSRSLTVRLVPLATEGASHLVELLLGILTNRGAQSRLVAGCIGAKSGAQSLASGPVKLEIPGLGDGETLLVMLVKDASEADRLQEHMADVIARKAAAVVSNRESTFERESPVGQPIHLSAVQEVEVSAQESVDCSVEQQASERLIARQCQGADHATQGLVSILGAAVANCKRALGKWLSGVQSP